MDIDRNFQLEGDKKHEGKGKTKEAEMRLQPTIHGTDM